MLAYALCLERKMTKLPFTANYNRSKGVLELVHTNVCEPLNVRSRGNFEYFVTLIDDYSMYDYVYLLHRNSEVFEKFKEFWPEAEKQPNKNIKSL